MTRPYVVIHNVLSIDGRIDGFVPDTGIYYESAAALDADCMLTGSDTILKAMEAEGVGPDEDVPASAPAVRSDDDLPLLVVVDSQGRVSTWQALREAGYWRDVMALISRSTPQGYRDYLAKGFIDHIAAGDTKVDLRVALEELGRRGVRKVRTDSGGTLNGVLLRQGLVDEVSLLLHPALAGGSSRSSVYDAPDAGRGEAGIELKIISSRRLKNGIVWLRYTVV